MLPGRDRRLPPVLIGAHYDSVIAAPSADDNAAAVAIALSAAEFLTATHRARDVVVALFDAEEPPYFLGPAMGSIRFCEDEADARGFHAAIVMDLVGHEFALAHPELANLLGATGIESSGALPALAGALTDTALDVPSVDTTAMEIRHLEATLRPVLPAVLAMLRMSALKTRADLARLAMGLQSLGV